MPRIWLVVISAVAGLLLLVITSAAVYLNIYPVDLSGMRTDIEKEIDAAIGRETKITGPITLGMSLIPFVKVEGLSVANEPWGKAKKFITIEQMNVRTRLFSLLSGAVEIVSIDVEGVVLNLEVDGRVRKNWNLVIKESNDEAIIEKMHFKNITVEFRDIHENKPKYTTHITEAKLNVEKDKAIFEFAGKLGDDDLTAQGYIAPLYSFANTPQLFDLKADALGIILKAGGKAKFPFRDSHTSANFHIDAPQGPGKLLAYLGYNADDFEKLEVKGNITGKGGILRVYDLDVNYGDLNSGGEVIIGVEHEPLRLSLNMKSGVMDIAPVLKTLEKKEASSPGRLFSAAPLDLEVPTGIDYDILYSADEINTENESLQNFALDAQIRNGSVNARKIEFDIFGGKVSSSVNLSPQGEKYLIKVKTRADSLEFDQLSKLLHWPELVTGKTAILLEANSSGDSQASFMADLQGRYYMQIKEGRLPSAFSSMMSGDVVDVFKNFKSVISGEKNEAIECAFVTFDINDGIAKAGSLLFLTRQAVVVGSGTVDLGQESLRLSLKPSSRDLSLVNFATELRVRGNITDPKLEINKSGVAKKAAVTALGLAFGPFGAAIGPATSIMKSLSQKSGPEQCAAAQKTAIMDLGDWPELRSLTGTLAE